MAMLLQEQNALLTVMSELERGIGPAPDVAAFERAAEAAYDPAAATALGLQPLLDASGNAVSETLASGMSASAFLDASGNVIIAYQGSTTDAQYQLDANVLRGIDASNLQGFSDAVTFASNVSTIAAQDGIAQNRVYVTGHSLGGTLASYVASQTGLAGTAFAGSGIPGYQASSNPAANFVSYVEKGDPFANYATDTAEASSAVVANARFAHYGTVVTLGSGADATALSGFASAIGGYSLGELEAGTVPITSQGINALAQEGLALLNAHHALGDYMSDTAAATVPASAFGLQNTTLAQFMTSLAHDRTALLADIPTIYHASSPGAVIGMFASDFPDLAREATSLMHARSFGAAIGDLAALSPTAYTALSSASGAAAILAALAHPAAAAIPIHMA